jgi:hypothetical protein
VDGGAVWQAVDRFGPWPPATPPGVGLLRGRRLVQRVGARPGALNKSTISRVFAPGHNDRSVALNDLSPKREIRRSRRVCHGGDHCEPAPSTPPANAEVLAFRRGNPVRRPAAPVGERIRALPADRRPQRSWHGLKEAPDVSRLLVCMARGVPDELAVARSAIACNRARGRIRLALPRRPCSHIGGPRGAGIARR